MLCIAKLSQAKTQQSWAEFSLIITFPHHNRQVYYSTNKYTLTLQYLTKFYQTIQNLTNFAKSYLGLINVTMQYQGSPNRYILIYCYNPGQSKAELLTWSSITIGKLPHHHTTPPPPYVPQLYRAIQYLLPQSRAEYSRVT